MAKDGFVDHLPQAEVLAQSAIDRTNCIFAMGVIRENERKDKEAVYYYRLAADRGDPNSMLGMGAIYHVGGNDVSVNLPLVLQWFKKARAAYDAGHYQDEFLSGLIDDNITAVELDIHPRIVEPEKLHYKTPSCPGNKHWSDFFGDCEY